MYMANARRHNATYIPLAGVGGLASGNAKKIASANAKYTNMLVYFALGNHNAGVGGIAQRQPPTPGILRSGGI